MTEELKNITIDILDGSELGEKLKYAFSIVEKIQKCLYALATDDNEDNLIQIKIGTVLALSVLGKIANGKMPKAFSNEDWKEIANEVSEQAILQDGQQYSQYIFELYAKYIDFSAESIRKKCSEETVINIKELAEQLRYNGKQLSAGEIDEVIYTEACLWVSLEAMIKILSASLTGVVGEDFGKLLQAVSIFGFEYGRYRLFKQEQEILTSYLEQQRIFDEKLQADLDKYAQELQEYENEFSNMVKHAFEMDIQSAFNGSVQLALEAGVKEDEVLKSIECIDDFFM